MKVCKKYFLIFLLITFLRDILRSTNLLIPMEFINWLFYLLLRPPYYLDTYVIFLNNGTSVKDKHRRIDQSINLRSHIELQTNFFISPISINCLKFHEYFRCITVNKTTSQKSSHFPSVFKSLQIFQITQLGTRCT